VSGPSWKARPYSTPVLSSRGTAALAPGTSAKSERMVKCRHPQLRLNVFDVRFCLELQISSTLTEDSQSVNFWLNGSLRNDEAVQVPDILQVRLHGPAEVPTTVRSFQWVGPSVSRKQVPCRIPVRILGPKAGGPTASTPVGDRLRRIYWTAGVVPRSSTGFAVESARAVDRTERQLIAGRHHHSDV
jgi:hypothetical protein